MSNRNLVIVIILVGIGFSLMNGLSFYKGMQEGRKTVSTYDQGYRDALNMDNCKAEDDCRADWNGDRWVIIYTPH